MRPARSSGLRLQSQTTFVSILSALASLYVLNRLWTSSSELVRLRREMTSLATVAAQQKKVIDTFQAHTAADSVQGPLFYNVRPASLHQDIPPLEGERLPAQDTDSIILDAADGNVVSQLDIVEDGHVRGWACVRARDGVGPTPSPPVAVLVYVDGVLIEEVEASKLVPLAPSSKSMCAREERSGTTPELPVGYQVKLPLLPQGLHEVQVFARSTDAHGTLVQAYHSPASFVESIVQPDAKEALRRKDAIILRRNAELAELWDEIKTQFPWKKAEAAFTKDAHRDDSEPEDGPASRLTALILVFSDAQHYQLRGIARKTWAPANRATARELREVLNIVIHFIMPQPQGAMAKRIEDEVAEFGDILIIDDPDEGGSQPRLVLAAIDKAMASGLEADSYVMTHDTVAVNVNATAEYFMERRGLGNGYFGCLKSGAVIGDGSSRWHEPEEWRFGDRDNDKLQYPRHAGGEFYAISRQVARYLARNRAVLHSYAFEDTTMGAWLLGLEVQYVDQHRFCCDSAVECKKPPKAGSECLALFENSCNGVCKPEETMVQVVDSCIKGKIKGSTSSETLTKRIMLTSNLR